MDADSSWLFLPRRYRNPQCYPNNFLTESERLLRSYDFMCITLLQNWPIWVIVGIFVNLYEPLLRVIIPLRSGKGFKLILRLPRNFTENSSVAQAFSLQNTGGFQASMYTLIHSFPWYTVLSLRGWNWFKLIIRFPRNFTQSYSEAQEFQASVSNFTHSFISYTILSIRSGHWFKLVIVFPIDFTESKSLFIRFHYFLCTKSL